MQIAVTKSVIETVGAHSRAPLQTLAIPATLQEALLARLDRLSGARQVAQLGATLGREFSRELLQAVTPLSEADLHVALEKLVEAEILYQRGIGEQTRYFFKHALIQDTAYQSLLKSTRQHYHQQIAQVLKERFPDTQTNQPELLAHHYTEAGLIEQAIPYWQRAGERANQHSAYVEAVAHLIKGLEVLKSLQDTPAHVQQELNLQLALSDALLPIKGHAAPEVGKVYTRTRELCQQLGNTPQLFPVLFRLFVFYFNRAELQTARKLAEQMMFLAQSVHDPYLLSLAHASLGCASYWPGELISARMHFEQAIALYATQQNLRSTVAIFYDPRWLCRSYVSLTLWDLGYPNQGQEKNDEAVTLAEDLSHPLTLAETLFFATLFRSLRREERVARERAEAVMTLATEQGFPYFLTTGMIVRGWALAEQGQMEEGIAQMHQGLAAWRATGAELVRSHYLSLLVEAYGKAGQIKAGLNIVTEALAIVDKTGERVNEAELYRLKGTLTLQQFNVQGSKFKVEDSSQSEVRSLESEAEECFLKAIEIAQMQQAKSWELRAATSLARLWQEQGKRAEAHELLSEVYNWFTEGFDTKDLQGAKALLRELTEEAVEYLN